MNDIQCEDVKGFLVEVRVGNILLKFAPDWEDNKIVKVKKIGVSKIGARIFNPSECEVPQVAYETAAKMALGIMMGRQRAIKAKELRRRLQPALF